MTVDWESRRFSSGEVMDLTKLTSRRYNYWISQGLLGPTHGAIGSGARRKLSILDMLILDALHTVTHCPSMDRADNAKMKAISVMVREHLEIDGESLTQLVERLLQVSDPWYLVVGEKSSGISVEASPEITEPCVVAPWNPRTFIRRIAR